MKVVVQRVLSAAVRTGDGEVSRIGEGMLALLGVARGDTGETARLLARKVKALRIFSDRQGRLAEALGEREILCVSQFTLLGDVSRGNRPGFGNAAPAEEAEPIYELFCEEIGASKGAFGEEMSIDTILDGPVTIEIEA
jgi:D-tyrosyl-tRNA(Tyr) deacylase